MLASPKTLRTYGMRPIGHARCDWAALQPAEDKKAKTKLLQVWSKPSILLAVCYRYITSYTRNTQDPDSFSPTKTPPGNRHVHAPTCGNNGTKAYPANESYTASPRHPTSFACFVGHGRPKHLPHFFTNLLYHIHCPQNIQMLVIRYDFRMR